MEKYLDAVFSLEPNQNVAGILGLAVQFCVKQNKMDILNKYRVGV